MPFHIVRNDITRMRVDAIVNAANPSLLGGGGVDGAIHRAAGPALREYCAGLGGCAVGSAKLSPGFRLPAAWIIHTVGPVWCGGDRQEEALLASCYRNSLSLALEKGCESLAFPLISAGAYGFPKDQALQIAVREIGAFLLAHEMEITLVVYDDASYQLSNRLFREVRSYLDKYLPDVPRPARNRREDLDLALASMEEMAASQASLSVESSFGYAMPAAAPQKTQKDGPKKSHSVPWKKAKAAAPSQSLGADSLDARLRQLDESFSQMLLRKIDEKGMKDTECYKRANVDRKLFSKIRSDPNYRPSKPTAIAFAIALELPLPEARDLLMKAGYALSHSNKFDIIIEYFIANGNYNIFEINETLFAFDQNLLGA